eukprot:82273-Pyramimonas_sp.AAC.1
MPGSRRGIAPLIGALRLTHGLWRLAGRDTCGESARASAIASRSSWWRGLREGRRWRRPPSSASSFTTRRLSSGAS